MYKLFAKYRINPKHEGFIVDDLATLKEDGVPRRRGRGGRRTSAHASTPPTASRL